MSTCVSARASSSACSDRPAPARPPSCASSPGWRRRTPGDLLIDGEPVTAKPPQKRGVGMVFQGLGLWPHMTVADTVAYGLVRRRLPAAQARAKVDFMLGLVGLADYAGKYPGELSGGQQQKVALARALVVEPRILLLDQPMSAIDPAFRAHLWNDIQSLQRELGITTIMVTHDPEEALAVADRIAVIRDGRGAAGRLAVGALRLSVGCVRGRFGRHPPT